MENKKEDIQPVPSKESQKQSLIELMEADQRDGIYGVSDNATSNVPCDAPFNSNEAIEQKAQEILYDMMKENSPKLLQFFLSCLARAMHSTNATDVELSCNLDVEKKRYHISSKCELSPVNTVNDESN